MFAAMRVVMSLAMIMIMLNQVVMWMSTDFIDVRSIPVMTMAMGVIVHVAITCVGFSCEVAANKKCEAKSRNHQSRSYAQPRVEPFRKDPLRCVKRDDTERIH